jgi:SAM-dependent methyltransferase
MHDPSNNHDERNHLYPEATAWFEELYARANGDPCAIPWVHMRPRKELVEWAFQKQPNGEDRTALVIGCGLGDDAELLAGLGYKVTAFDVSPTAVDWCRRRFPNSAVDYVVADMFDPSAAWRRAFDLVLEIYIVQALPIPLRQETVAAVADFVASGGVLLAIGRGIEDGDNRSGPPWALTPAELAIFEGEGLTKVQFDRRNDRQIAPQFRYRAEFVRLHQGSSDG